MSAAQKRSKIIQGSTFKCFVFCLTNEIPKYHFLSLRVYSHQESLLVHLLWSKYNVDFFFVGAVRFHTALFASNPETVNKTTRVLKVIHSLVHPFNCTRVRLETTSSAGSRYGSLVRTRVRMLYSHLPKYPHQGRKRTWVWFNRTKQDRCEYTLRYRIDFSLFGTCNVKCQIDIFYRILI